MTDPLLPPAVVRGRAVCARTGQPLARALVLACLGRVDLRHLTLEPDRPRWSVCADDQGRFELSLPRAVPAAVVSLDIRSPGHRTLAGTARRAPDGQLDSPGLVAVEAGLVSQLDVELPPALYVAGQLLDPDRQPVAHARLTTFVRHTDGRGHGAVAATQSDAQGRFEVMDLPDQLPAGLTAEIIVEDHRFCRQWIENLYDRPPAELADLRVELSHGRRIEGRVLNSQGQGVPGLTVTAHFDLSEEDRSAPTGPTGLFRIRGLCPLPCTLIAHPSGTPADSATPGASEASASLSIRAGHDDVRVTLCLPP